MEDNLKRKKNQLLIESIAACILFCVLIGLTIISGKKEDELNKASNNSKCPVCYSCPVTNNSSSNKEESDPYTIKEIAMPDYLKNKVNGLFSVTDLSNPFMKHTSFTKEELDESYKVHISILNAETGCDEGSKYEKCPPTDLKDKLIIESLVYKTYERANRAYSNMFGGHVIFNKKIDLSSWPEVKEYIEEYDIYVVDKNYRNDSHVVYSIYGYQVDNDWNVVYVRVGYVTKSDNTNLGKYKVYTNYLNNKYYYTDEHADINNYNSTLFAKYKISFWSGAFFKAEQVD